MARTKSRRRAVADIIALYALQGRVAPIPVDMDAREVLSAMLEMGGIELGAEPDEIMAKAERLLSDGGRVAYISVNLAGLDRDLQVLLILDVPETPVKNERDLLSNDGYTLAYVWNASTPWCSEAGDIVLQRMADGYIHRVG